MTGTQIETVSAKIVLDGAQSCALCVMQNVHDRSLYHIHPSVVNGNGKWKVNDS